MRIQDYTLKRARFYIQSLVFGALFVILMAVIWKPFSHTASLNDLHLLDFDNYQHLLKDIHSGLNPYTVSHMITLGPPLVILFYLPFSIFPLHSAQVVFLLLNILCGLIACYMLAKSYNPRFGTLTFLIVSILLLISFPARFSLQMGQPNLILLFLGTILMTADSTLKRSLSLAIMIITKTFFIGVLLSLFRKQKTVVLVTTVFLSLAVVLSLLVCRPSWDVYYVTHTLGQVSLGRSTDQSLDYYNQSIKSTFHRLNVDSIYIPFFILFILFGGYSVYVTQRVDMALIFSLLASPVLWQHYLTIVFGLFVVVFFRSKSRYKYILLLLCYGLWSINVSFLQGARPTLLNGILASHGLISLLLLLYTVHLVEWKESGTLIKQ